MHLAQIYARKTGGRQSSQNASVGVKDEQFSAAYPFVHFRKKYPGSG